MAELLVEAWRVHDTGLVAVPSRFRRLGGLVRHLQGQGDAWPDTITLILRDAELHVAAATGPVGVWPLAEVHATQVSAGPPVSFVLEVTGGSHLLAAAADAATQSLLAALLG